MRYTVDGFNHKVLVNCTITKKDGAIENANIDANDVLILRYVIDFSQCHRIKKFINPADNEEYYWISYQTLIDELPLLRISDKEAIAKRLRKLCDAGILKHYCHREGGTFSCYKPGYKYYELISDSYKKEEKKPEEKKEKALEKPSDETPPTDENTEGSTFPSTPPTDENTEQRSSYYINPSIKQQQEDRQDIYDRSPPVETKNKPHLDYESVKNRFRKLEFSEDVIKDIVYNKNNDLQKINYQIDQYEYLLKHYPNKAKTKGFLINSIRNNWIDDNYNKFLFESNKQKEDELLRKKALSEKINHEKEVQINKKIREFETEYEIFYGKPIDMYPKLEDVLSNIFGEELFSVSELIFCLKTVTDYSECSDFWSVLGLGKVTMKTHSLFERKEFVRSIIDYGLNKNRESLFIAKRTQESYKMEAV